jgi:hypothetical protein
MNSPIKFKLAILRTWRINLFRPDVHAPLPWHILRRMGAA